MLQFRLFIATKVSKSHLKAISAIKVAPIKITDDFCCKWKPSHAYHKIKMNGTQRRALVSP